MRPVRQFQLLIGLLVGVAACDQDPFGMAERRVVGDYRLERWEDGTTYYLVGPGPAKSGGGTIDGTVERIGWSDSIIVAHRKGLVGKDGWMIVEVDCGRVSGPLSDAEFRRQAAYQRLKIYHADSAWAHLE